jgi:type III pantothenate kinase
MLAIDVGNTHITIGFFEEGELKDLFRVPTEVCLKSASFLEYLPPERKLLSSGTVMASVRAAAAEIIGLEIKAVTGTLPFMVHVGTPMGIEISYDTKETLGIDRVVAAAAAHYYYRRPGRALVVVDMGTATTIDFVDEQGRFLGGMITPGLMSAYRGLLSAAPQLPRVEDLSGPPVIGKNTFDCIRSGVVTGHAAMIRGAVEMMSEERGSPVSVVLTGGLSVTVKDFLPPEYVRDEVLILKGLSFIYTLHNKNTC